MTSASVIILKTVRLPVSEGFNHCGEGTALEPDRANTRDASVNQKSPRTDARMIGPQDCSYCSIARTRCRSNRKAAEPIVTAKTTAAYRAAVPGIDCLVIGPSLAEGLSLTSSVPPRTAPVLSASPRARRNCPIPLTLCSPIHPPCAPIAPLQTAKDTLPSRPPYLFLLSFPVARWSASRRECHRRFETPGQSTFRRRVSEQPRGHRLRHKVLRLPGSP